jgi:hypothetical protein
MFIYLGGSSHLGVHITQKENCVRQIYAQSEALLIGRGRQLLGGESINSLVYLGIEIN